MKRKIITKLMWKMKRSGYSQGQRVEALRAGVRRYRRLKGPARKGVRALHRLSAGDREEERSRTRK